MESHVLEYRLTFLVVSLIGIPTILYLFDLFRSLPGEVVGEGPLSVSPATLGGVSRRTLILASVLGLFLELLLIRWISSEIRIFAYFKNFVLIACFLGFGLGFQLCRQRIQLLPTLIPLGFFALLIELPWPGLRALISDLPLYLASFSDLQIWGVLAVGDFADRLGAFLAAIVFSVMLFGMITLTFVSIGQLIGWQIENADDGIRAYSLNIAGSLAGILAFTLLSYLGQSPIVWFAVAGGLLTVTLWRAPRLRWASAGTTGICLLLLVVGRDDAVRWSPYQKLELEAEVQNGETIAYHLRTNDSWHQKVVDLSPEFLAAHPELAGDRPTDLDPYNLPYRFYEDAPEVLILGAGMGNDVAAALRNGAGRVVAVEIDPLILDLGRELHFEKPYGSSRVEIVEDDARSYIGGSDEEFDLIVFSLLDSQTNASHFSNIRIDNFVYTVEALHRARELLAPDGVFIVKFQVHAPWIAARLRGLLSETFDRDPIRFTGPVGGYTSSGSFFVTGSPTRLEAVLGGHPELARLVEERPLELEPEDVVLTTDDWPYFYQRAPGLPVSVLALSCVLMGVCWLAIGRVGLQRGSVRWHFFFLGAAFLLLETQLVSKAALLFGTTWVVNSLVITFVLLMILGANVLVEKVPSVSTNAAYSGLAATVVLAFVIPLDWLLVESVWLRALLVGLVLCLPVFFASIVFIQSFAAVDFGGDALGSNLFGALVGGVLESLSLWLGLRSLLILAAVLYVASWFLRRFDLDRGSALA